MADLARLFNYITGQPIKQSEVDAELDMLVAGHNAQEDALELLSTYRTIASVYGWLGDAGYASAGDLLFSSRSPGGVGPGCLVNEATDVLGALSALYLDDADYAVTGKTTKLRIRAQAYVNGIAPGRTFTVGLYPITAVGGAGGAEVIQATLGAVLAGSTVPFASPAIGSRSAGASADFAFPGDDHYALGVNLAGGAITANSVVAICAHLQVRHV